MQPDTPLDVSPEDPSGSKKSGAPPSLVGAVLGNSYEVVRLLGMGGMGAVYEARHLRLPRRAALKVMQPEIASNRTSFERFKREAEIASSLGNRHIVQVFDFDYLADGSPYLLMEFLEGQDLAETIHRRGALRPAEAARILEQAVSALTAAHERGIVHRDIKPANMFLARESDGAEVLKLLDFGLCKARTGATSLTHDNIVGTPLYMSPEQLRASSEVDQRADVYSLGVVLFEMLTGRLPYDHDHLVQLVSAVLHDPVPSMRTIQPWLPGEADTLIARAIAKDPADRFGSVAELWEAARPVLENAERLSVEPVPIALCTSDPVLARTVDLLSPTLGAMGPVSPRAREVRTIVLGGLVAGLAAIVGFAVVLHLGGAPANAPSSPGSSLSPPLPTPAPLALPTPTPAVPKVIPAAATRSAPPAPPIERPEVPQPAPKEASSRSKEPTRHPKWKPAPTEPASRKSDLPVTNSSRL